MNIQIHNVWKFTLKEDDIVNLKYLNIRDIDREWMKIKNGILTIPKGYSWDGCTPKIKVNGHIIGIPDFGTKTEFASLVHDVFYQYASENLLTRKQVDQLFLSLMLLSGFRGAYLYYFAVRSVAWMFWKGKK
jgi:hypothetical protein